MERVVTLLDVARAANVSKTTVSNVFSWPERVRPALRERVKAAARELGYAGPDPKGRMLSSGKVKAIGVVPVGDFGITLFFTHEYDNAFLGGVAQTCEERGVGLSLVSGRQKGWGINEALVDGFILASVEQIDLIEPARRRRLPVVVTGVAGPDVSSITTENRKGAREVTRHLLELGHRRFVIASALFQFLPPVFHPPSKAPRRFVAAGLPMMERMAGVADALAEFGQSLDDMPIMEACATPEEEAAFGVNGAAALLDGAPEATAVIGLTDGVALSIIEHAKKRGLLVPRDLSVVGFDDVAGAARSEPPLTTIHFSAFESGRLAARLLLDGGPTQHMVMPVELVVRGSTAPPRK
jgi:DNA-binding LacI/PurR family transcriptional regulator